VTLVLITSKRAVTQEVQILIYLYAFYLLYLMSH